MVRPHSQSARRRYYRQLEADALAQALSAAQVANAAQAPMGLHPPQVIPPQAGQPLLRLRVHQTRIQVPLKSLQLRAKVSSQTFVTTPVKSPVPLKQLFTKPERISARQQPTQTPCCRKIKATSTYSMCTSVASQKRFQAY